MEGKRKNVEKEREKGKEDTESTRRKVRDTRLEGKKGGRKEDSLVGSRCGGERGGVRRRRRKKGAKGVKKTGEGGDRGKETKDIGEKKKGSGARERYRAKSRGSQCACARSCRCPGRDLPASLSLRDAGGGDRDSTPISSRSDNIVHLARLLSVHLHPVPLGLTLDASVYARYIVS